MALRQRHGSQANLYHAVAADFVEKHSKPNNRSWRVSARHLGLRVADDETLSAAPTGYYTRWSKRSVGSLTKIEVQELVDEVRNTADP
jgi:hypothetical protein